MLLNCCDPQTSRKLIRNLSNISTYWFRPLSIHNQYVSLWSHHNSNKAFAHHLYHISSLKCQAFKNQIFFTNIFHFQETSNESSPSVYRQIKMGLAGHGGFKRFKWFHLWRSVILWWQLAVNSDFQSLDVLDYANVKCDDGICVEEKMLGCDFPAFIKKCIFLLWMCFPQVRFDQPTTGTGNKQKYF